MRYPSQSTQCPLHDTGTECGQISYWYDISYQYHVNEYRASSEHPLTHTHTQQQQQQQTDALETHNNNKQTKNNNKNMILKHSPISLCSLQNNCSMHCTEKYLKVMQRVGLRLQEVQVMQNEGLLGQQDQPK